MINIRPSTITGAGNGVFATRDIRKGTVIGEYVGKVLHGPHPSVLPREVPYVYFTRGGNTIAPYKSCLVRYINDNINVGASKTIGRVVRYPQHPHNVEFVERDENVRVVATADIPEDEELFLSYGPSYWNPRIKPGNRGRRSKDGK